MVKPMTMREKPQFKVAQLYSTICELKNICIYLLVSQLIFNVNSGSLLQKEHFLSLFIKRFPPSNQQEIPVCIVFFYFIFCILFSSFAQTNMLKQEEIDYYQTSGIQPFVSNEQDGDYPGGTYLVIHDLIIEKGKTMTLYPGTKILFKKDTRLIIKGLLICQGKYGEPIIFDKLDNNAYFNPIDSAVDTKWDGIYVSDSATLEMKCTEIRDSKYGIVAKRQAAGLILDSIQFNNNKYHSIRFGTELPDVPENKLLSIVWSGLDNQDPEINIIGENNSSIRFVPTRKVPSIKLDASFKNLMTKKHTRLTTEIAAVVGAAVGVSGYYIYKHYYSLYNSSNARDPNKTDPATVSDYKSMVITGYWSCIGGAALGAISICGFTLTFVF